MCNGQNVVKFDGSKASNWGIATPTVDPTTSDPSSAGVMTGTFEILYTYYNSATGTESSPSDASNQTTLSSEQLRCVWSASADTQVTDVYVYVRNVATEPVFYRAATVAIGTLTTDLNVTTTNLIVKAPDIGENDPPVAGTKLCELHYSHMFISNGVDVFFSDENKPENFDPSHTLPGINRNEGEDVTALHSSNGYLIIAKRSRSYILVGDHPDNWRIEEMDPSIGCTSAQSMVTAEGTTRWWSLLGMVEWDPAKGVVTKAHELIDVSVHPDAINYSELHRVSGAMQEHQHRCVWSVPGVGKTRNNFYIPYNYRLGVFESDAWTAVDGASIAQVETASGANETFIGGYAGQTFQLWDADNDGVATATTMTGAVTSATSLSITSSAGGFDTAGGGLAERYVVVFDPDSLYIQRARIASNTATVLTLAEALSTVPTSTWTFVVGGIDFAWDTRWMTGTEPFIRKRYRFLYLLTGSTQTSVDLDLSIFFDFENTAAKKVTTTLSSIDELGVWDVGKWDEAQFAAQSASHKRVRVAKKGRSWKLRIENRQPNETVVIHKVGSNSEVLTDKNPV